CIGCGACVAACPEGDVLGMVGGQAVIVNGSRCIGIAACEPACPVGAVRVGLGDVHGREDLPVLDEHRQSSVPGLFVVGELGGLSLVRNAIEQGRETVEHVARRLAESGPPEGRHDLVIVGAGPSGLAAALAATEARLDYVVLEQAESLGGTISHYPRRKLVQTQPARIPLWGELAAGEHTKEELLELFTDLHRRYRLRIDFDRRVTGVVREKEGFRVDTGGGSYAARYVMLALGRRGTPRRLGVPGEELSKVAYQVRDAEQYRHRRILCVGGGDSAVEAALGLGSQPGNEVTLSYRRDRFGRIKRKNEERLELAVAEGRVRLLVPSNVREIRPDTVALDHAGNPTILPNDDVFILVGGLPPFAMLREMGIRFGDEMAAADDEARSERSI
ncbi:MAG: NAD(P)-binding domain-containing protein, partial [Thermoanaerobaculia bacterium]|nr:NAD(P)-binding domain-containing protein [Thermoanaerobaculia bacterium]